MGRTVRTWGYRGVRVGEASHPGPRLLRRYPRGRGGAPTIVDSDEEPLFHARDTIAVSQPSTFPASHGALMVADRGFPPLTEVESEASDPEERVDSVDDSLQHDLEGRTPSPIVDLSSSTPKRSPMVRCIPDEVDDDHLIRPTNGRFVVPRLEHVSVDVSSQVAGVHEFEVGATIPASPLTLHAVARVTNQNRFEALSEDIADVVGQPFCAQTWFDSSRAEGSAGDHRSGVVGQCDAVPASSNADFRGRIAQVCDSSDRPATRAPTRRLRLVGGERLSQATTIAARIEPEKNHWCHHPLCHLLQITQRAWSGRFKGTAKTH